MALRYPSEPPAHLRIDREEHSKCLLCIIRRVDVLHSVGVEEPMTRTAICHFAEERRLRGYCSSQVLPSIHERLFKAKPRDRVANVRTGLGSTNVEEEGQWATTAYSQISQSAPTSESTTRRAA